MEEVEDKGFGLFDGGWLGDAINECGQIRMIRVKKKMKYLIIEGIAANSPFLARSKRKLKRFVHLLMKTIIAK